MPMRFYPVTNGSAWDTCRGCEADIAPGDPCVLRQDTAKFCARDCGEQHGTAPLRPRRVVALALHRQEA